MERRSSEQGGQRRSSRTPAHRRRRADDRENYAVPIGEALSFDCLEAESGESALALLEEQSVHMILGDMVMPQMSGLEFLEKVKKLLPRTEVVMMTGHGSIESAVQAMKLGAYDCITKPFSPLEELRLFLRRMARESPSGRGERVLAPAE